MYRIGNVPRRPEDSELFQHMWTRKGFFGAYANLYKTQSPGEPVRWDPRLGPASLDVAQAHPSDLDDARGQPLPLLTNGDITVSVSRRRETMPFCWRNVDADELYFIHRGRARFESEFGVLDAEPGDFVFLPRNAVYRVVPRSSDTVHLILETQSMLETADRYHREHGETSLGLDLSLIGVPEPGTTSAKDQSEYEVCLKVDGELYSMFYDYDPVGVTAGWAGDPIVFKLSGWDVPAARLPSTPPTAAIFMSDGSEAVVTVHTPPRGGLLTTRGGGPPAHTNDYDELWFLHAPENAAGGPTMGQLRWDPQGLTQAGARRRNSENGMVGRPPDVPVLNVNVDVRKRLRLTPEAVALMRERASMANATA
jgi:homogentisate 1,2-dioxygenase